MPRMFFASTARPVRALLFGGFFGLLALSMALPGFFVSKAAAQTIYPVADETDLNEALKNATDNDTIQFTGNITVTGNLNSTNASVIIDGGRHVLDGKGLYSLLNATGNLTSVGNLNFNNGDTLGNGAAVSVGGNLTNGISNSNFTNNSAHRTNATSGDGYGGAVYVFGNLAGGISGSSFTNNTAYRDGGAVYVNGSLSGGITGSTFSGNNATYGSGGAVSVNGNLLGGISGSTFSGNNSTGYGGAVFVGGSLTNGISNSTFTGNNGDRNGGAVYVGGNLTNGISGSTFTGNNGDGAGGAVFVGGDLSDGIINSSFTGNNAIPGGGGAVYVGGALSDGIINSSFTGNQAVYGGAVEVRDNLAGGIKNSSFSGNNARYEGGAVNVDKDLLGGISGSSFTNNTASRDGGGAVYVEHNLNDGISGSNFTGNTATNGFGGAVYVNGTLTGGVSGSAVSGNTATQGGGAVFVNGTLTGGVSGSTFSGNTAGVDGGTVDVEGNLTGGVSGSTFANNTAHEYGGAVYVSGTLTGGISNSSFTGNNATLGNGGAVCVGGDLLGGISASNFANNTSSYGVGGAMYVHYNLTGGISGSNFTGNSAEFGGAVRVLGNLLGGISGSSFSGNNASDGSGGAVRIVGDLLGGISASTFSGNRAGTSGGAVYVDGNMNSVITDSSFVDNTAVNGTGGAIYLYNYADVNSSLTLTATAGQSTVFSGNRDLSGPNSMYFGAGGDNDVLDPKPGNATLLVSPAGTVDLRDPIRVAMNSTREKQVFTMRRDDSLASGGRFAWGGVNVLEADGGASVNLAAGRTDLAADFTLTGLNDKPLNLAIGAKHSLSLNFAQRDPDLPVFDFTNANASSTIDAPETHISAPRTFISQSGTVLLIDADKLSAFNLTDANFIIDQSAAFTGKARLQGRKVWLDLDYHISFNSPNTARALPALEQWLQNSAAGIALSDQQFNDLVMDLDSAAPEAAVSSAGQALSISSVATGTALAQGLGNSVGQAYNGASFTSLAAGTVNSAIGGNMFRQANADRAQLSGGRSLSFAGGANLNWKLPDNTPGIIDGWNPVNPQSKTRFLSAGLDRSMPTDNNAAPQAMPGYGPRLWAGYLGNFNHASKNKDYSGYDADTHGFLAGLTWEADRHWTFGAYGGYSHTDMDYDIHADLTADAGHFGLFSRYATDYGLKIAADLGYTLISNDLKRSPDGVSRSKGSFDQDVWSLGLNFSYDIEPWQYGRITPFAGGSFTWLHQDAFNEHGGDLDSHVNAVNYNNFSTVLGASVAHDFLICDDSVVLTPSFTAAYRHDFGKTQMDASTNFLSPMITSEAPITYSVKSRPTEPNAAILDVALDAMFKTDSDLQWGLKAAYGVELRGHSQDHSVFAGAEVRF